MTETACCDRCGADAGGPENGADRSALSRVRGHLSTVAMLLLGVGAGALVAGAGSSDAALLLVIGAAAMSWFGGCDCESC